jgi:NAD(P)-dependent dehydrogenase (short-subunit alcohol dehydrogenase family)
MSVLITGAVGVLGRALVQVFEGYSLAIATGHNLDAAEKLAAQVRDAGGTAMALIGDLAGVDRDAVASDLVRRVHDELGPIEVLINNAADQSMGDWRTQSAAEVDAIVAGTYGSVVAMGRAALPVMSSGGSIINIASVEGFIPFPNHAHYAAAKAAVLSLTTSMAGDLVDRGIRVNVIAPGLIDRQGLADEWPEGVQWWSRTSPLGRPVTAAEVAQAAYDLVQDGDVTGAVVAVDGGWLDVASFSDVAALRKSHQP